MKRRELCPRRRSDSGRAVTPTTPRATTKRVRRTPEAAREHILETARRLITERGPDAVGLKDVGRAAQVSHTLVVHYFGGYEALVQEVLRTGAARLRTQLLARLEAHGPLDPASWLTIVFDEMRRPDAGRLALWAFLTGRLERSDSFFHHEQGLKLVCDALETRLAAVLGPAAPSREDLEATVIMGLAAAWGYGIAGHIFWPALGREPTQERDDAMRERLGRTLVQSLLGGPRSR